MEGARPARTADLERCGELLVAARDAAVSRRGGALLVAGGASTAGAPGGAGPGGGDPPGDGDPTAVARWWADRPGERILLAGVYEGEVVGVGAGRVGPMPTGDGDLLGIVDCCYVEPDAREVGVGGALAAALVSWFTERGCSGVDAPSLPGDRTTKQLFESAGFSARLIVLHRRLP